MGEQREFTLPDLGEGLEDGEVVRWHVEVGDTVALNDPIVEVETAKAVVDVPCPFAGRVVARFGEEGETIAVGAVLVRIEVESGDGQRRSVLDAEEEPQPLVGYGASAAPGRRRRRGASRPQPELEPQAGPASEVLAKPPVRKLAAELGVDLADLVPGAGPQGSITRAEVEAAAAPATAPAAAYAPGFRGRRPGEVEEIRGVRRRIVEKMETARREIPAASCARDADLTALWELRNQLTAQAAAQGAEVRITPLALILKATVVALRRFPTLNARIARTADGGGTIHLLEELHLGVAVDTDRGLLVPVIDHADTRSTLELARELARLGGAARTGRLTPGEVTGGTFTVNNYGAFGNDDGEPIINHPEGAILGIGAIRPRPWVVTGPDGREELAIRRVGRFRLAFDHRICDGGEAGRFVTEVAELCEHPERLLLHV